MSGTNLGSAYVTVVPKLTGASSAISSGLSGVNLSGSGATMGAGLMSGIQSSVSAGSIALGNLVTAGVQTAVSAVAGFAGSIVQTGSDFEASMAKVAALSGAGADDLSMLEETAKSYGATTQFSASEAADALGYMALAGWDAQTSAGALGGVLDLAAASGMGLAEASDMVTDYLSAFGMAASDSAYFADLLAYAQANSNTSAAQLGEAYRNCAANMSAAGQDVETTTSLLSMLANQGLKGSEAGTALAAIMRDLQSKCKDGSVAIGDTAVALYNADGSARDLTDVLLDVESATDGMTDAQRAAALGQVFTADSTKGLNLLLAAGIGTAADFEEALRGAGGAAGDMAQTMNDTLAGDMKALDSALEGLQLDLYDAVSPALRGAAQVATDTLVPAVGTLTGKLADLVWGTDQTYDVFDEFGTKTGTVSEHTDGLVDRLAPLVEQVGTGVGGAFETAATKVGEFWDDVSPDFDSFVGAVKDAAEGVGTNLAGAFSALEPVAGPASELLSGLAEGALAGLFQIGSDAAAGMELVSAGFKDIAEVAGPPLADFFERLDLSPAAEAFDAVRSSLGDSLAPVIETFNDTLLPALGELFGSLDDNAEGVNGLISDLFQGAGDLVGVLGDAAGQGLVTSLTLLADGCGVLSSALSGDFSSAWSGAVQFAEDLGTGLNNLVDTLFPDLVQGMEGVGTTVSDAWGTAWSTAETAVRDFSTGVAEAADEAFPGLSGHISGIVESLGEGDWAGAWEGAKGAASDVMGGLLTAAEENFPQTTAAVQGFVGDVAAAFGEWGIADTVSATWTALEGFIEDPVGTLTTTVGGFVGAVSTAFSSWGVDTTVDGIFQNVRDFIEDPVASARDFLMGIPDEIVGFFSGLGDSITSAIGSISFPVPHVTWETLSVFGYDTPINLPHVEWYATGGIATAATVIGVGEDGAEGVIPLEGRRKMAPFADEIASRVSAEVGSPAGNTCNVFIDGAHVNDSEEINDAVRDFLLRLSEIGAI